MRSLNKWCYWLSVIGFAVTMLWLIYTDGCVQLGATAYTYRCTTDIECYEECVQVSGEEANCHHIYE